MNADRDAGQWRRDFVRRLDRVVFSAVLIAAPRFGSLHAQDALTDGPTNLRYITFPGTDATWQRRVAVMNPGTSSTQLSFSGYNAQGGALSSSLAPLDVTAGATRFMDPVASPSAPGTLLTFHGSGSYLATVSLLSADGRKYEIVEASGATSPHLVFPALHEDSSHESQVLVTNTGVAPTTIEVTARDGNGNLIASAFLRAIAPAASLRFTAAEIFGAIGVERVRTLSVVANQPLVGWQFVGAPHGDLAVLPGLFRRGTSWSFPIVPSTAGTGLRTAVGVLNPGPEAVSVVMEARDENDLLVARTELDALSAYAASRSSTSNGTIPHSTRRLQLSASRPVIVYGVVTTDDGAGVAAAPAFSGLDLTTAGFELHALPSGALALSRLVRTEGGQTLSLLGNKPLLPGTTEAMTIATRSPAGTTSSATVLSPRKNVTPMVPVRAAAPARIFVVNSKGDAADANPGDGSASTGGTVLRNGQPEPEVTLRSALTEADMTPELDEIRFDVPGAAVTIFPQGSVRGILGALHPVVVDGTTQPMDGIVIIDGSQAGTHDPAGREMVGIELVGVGSTIRGLFITRFAFDGVRIRQSGGPNSGNIVEGNVIQSNDRHGIYISDSPNNLIGGTTPQAMNLIVLNKGNGIRIDGAQASGNKIQGNRIGTDRTGTMDRSNLDDQIAIDRAPDTLIGEPNVGPAPATPGGASNVIVGKRLGVNIDGLLTTTTSTKVNANFIGLDTVEATLTGGIVSNGSLLTAGGNVITKVSGVEIQAFFQVNGMVDIRHNQLKGDAVEGLNLRFDEGREMTLQLEENVILNARRGIVAEESIRGHFTWNALKNTVEADEDALRINFHTHGEKVFGGRWKATAGAALLYNVDVSDTLAARLRVEADVTGGTGGVVGTVRAATIFTYLAEGGTRRGGLGSGDKVTLGVGFSGQMEARYRNIDASFCAEAGLWLENQTGFRSLLTVFIEHTTARENIIGLNLLNLRFGNTAESCTIVDNRDAGIRLSQGTDGRILNSTIAGNGIGVEILDTANAVLEGNVLTANGIALAMSGTGTGTRLAGNSLFANATLGIDLGRNGVTPNDPGDADAGPNGLQNFPLLTTATSSSPGTNITGTLESAPASSFTLEFFSNSAPHPSGFGEGELPLGTALVTTDSSGRAAFTVTLASVLPTGRFVSATATDAAGNTSEFSPNVAVNGSANATPTANAGADQTVSAGSPVVLDGSASFDPDLSPQPLSHLWAQSSGPAVTLTGATTAKPMFTPMTAGIYSFLLTVSDGLASSNDSVAITVVSAGNIPPQANAGPDQTVAVGAHVGLDGTGSIDPDRGPASLTYAWTQTGGPSVSMKRADTAKPSFTPSQLGSYVFVLRVGDGAASAQDDVKITVLTGVEQPLQELMAAVNASPLPQSVKIQLLAPLQAALDKLFNAQISAALVDLNAFLRLVDALQGAQSVSKHFAHDLSHAADKIIKGLEHLKSGKGA